MPKPRSLYVCNQCGGEFPKYLGKCPACGEWNSLVEQVAIPAATANRGAALATRTVNKSRSAPAQAPQPLTALTLPQIVDHPQIRFPSGYTEFDRVLGGGIVPGSLVPIGGDPGIGKSTLLLQVANQLATRYRTLYVCAEESGQQVKLRSQRLGIGTAEQRSRKKQPEKEPAETQPPTTLKTHSDADLFLLPEIDLEAVIRELEALRPQVAVIDSIQALYFAALNSAPGSVAQVQAQKC
jgi:DNA repair protein RadA/Sms